MVRVLAACILVLLTLNLLAQPVVWAFSADIALSQTINKPFFKVGDTVVLTIA